MRLDRPTLAVLMVVAVSWIAAGWVTLTRQTGSEVGAARRLPDGSTLELAQVTFGTNFTYERHKRSNKIASLVMPIRRVFPKLRWFPHRGGILTMGTFPADTNLFVVTVNGHSNTNWRSALGRVTVFDEQGNSFDPCWDVRLINGDRWASSKTTVTLPGEIVSGWWIRPFPRRCKTIGLRFYFADATSGRWGGVAEYKIPNPAYTDYPQWIPDPLPAVRTNGDLQLGLKEFQTGIAAPIPGATDDDRTVPRKTRLVFEFSRNGKPVNDCVIQSIVISDATGNWWIPYHTFLKKYGVPTRNSQLASATNGVVEFLGALWPGENAWKLEVEFTQPSGSSQDQAQPFGSVQFLARPDFVKTVHTNAPTNE